METNQYALLTTVHQQQVVGCRMDLWQRTPSLCKEWWASTLLRTVTSAAVSWLH